MRADSRVLRTAYILLNSAVLLVGVALALTSSAKHTARVAVGTSLIAAGLAALLLSGLQFLTTAADEHVANTLRQAARLGLRSVHSQRPHFHFADEKRLSEARQVDILGISLRTFWEDNPIGQIFASCGKVRILLLDPNHPTPKSSLAKLRDAEEGRVEGTVAHEVALFVQRFGTATQAGDDRVEMRFYRALPTVSYMRVDEIAYWSVYLDLKDGASSPTVEINRCGDKEECLIFSALQSHFDRLWDKSSPPAATPQSATTPAPPAPST